MSKFYCPSCKCVKSVEYLYQVTKDAEKKEIVIKHIVPICVYCRKPIHCLNCGNLMTLEKKRYFLLKDYNVFTQMMVLHMIQYSCTSCLEEMAAEHDGAIKEIMEKTSRVE